MNKHPRTFVGILPEYVKANQLEPWGQKFGALAQRYYGESAVPPEKIHITIKFIGKQPLKLDAFPDYIPPFMCYPIGTGCFDTPIGKAAYIEVTDDHGYLDEMHRFYTELYGPDVIERGKKTFHITLAKGCGVYGVPKELDIAVEIPVKRVHILFSMGSTYMSKRDYRLEAL